MLSHKLRQTLTKIVGGLYEAKDSYGKSCVRDWHAEAIADAILQSPGLRVELLDSRYLVCEVFIPNFRIGDKVMKPDPDRAERYAVQDDKWRKIVAEFPHSDDGRNRAEDYAAWLNSNEPK